MIGSGNADGRWRMHDLIRLYAAQHPDAESDDWAEALTQLLLYYLNTANDATERLNPASARLAAIRFADRERAGLARRRVPQPHGHRPRLPRQRRDH